MTGLEYSSDILRIFLSILFSSSILPTRSSAYSSMCAYSSTARRMTRPMVSTLFPKSRPCSSALSRSAVTTTNRFYVSSKRAFFAFSRSSDYCIYLCFYNKKWKAYFKSWLLSTSTSLSWFRLFTRSFTKKRS